MLVFIAAAALLLPWLGATLFYSKGEPREAVVAMSILRDGNWILPTYFGGEIPFKPPLLAWLIAVFAKLLTGGVVTEYVSRLPSALAALGMIMAGFVWAKRVCGNRFAIAYSLIQLTCFEILRAGVACRLDMLLTACMVTSIYMLYDLSEYRRRFRLLRYTTVVCLLTAAVMTKGPVGALLPCFIIGVFRLCRGRRFFPTLGAMLGLAALAMILPALWAYAAYGRGGNEFAALMYEENIGRLTSTMSYGSHVKPIWYNFVTLVAGLLPWTLLLLLSTPLLRLPEPAKWLRQLRAHWLSMSAASMLSLLAAVLTVTFYCIPESKRSVYLLPAYPFICYGITRLFLMSRAYGQVKIFTWLLAIICLGAPLLLACCSIFGWVEGIIMPGAWCYAVLAVPSGCSLAWIIRRCHARFMALALAWALWAAYLAAGMPAVLNSRCEKPVADTILSRAGNADILLLQTQPKFRLYALNFYLGDRMCPVADVVTAVSYPSGTVVIADARGDTAGLSQAFAIENLAPTLAEFHSPIIMAVRK